MRMDEMTRADEPTSPTARAEWLGELGEAMDGKKTRVAAQTTAVAVAARRRWRLVRLFMGVPWAANGC